jgi:glycerol-3-phosphate dehydrogenase
VSGYDLLVIGGGINGLGIAAEAARLGLHVLLVERGDFGGATTAASSRLIHGGLRYLQYGELSLVRESLRERGRLARERPHLVRPIQLLIPSYRVDRLPAWKIGIGLRLYNLLASDPLFPRAHGLSPLQALAREPGLDPTGLSAGHVYPDGQVDFPERLCIELMREALSHSAEVFNHTRVTELRTAGSRVTGARLQDELDRREWEVDAALTINATGPWVDCVNCLLPDPPPRLIGGTCGTHIVLPLREGGPNGHLYATAKRDGRPFFILPWDGRLLVGTTDVRLEGSPDGVRTEDWEIDYLLTETNRLFPEATYTRSDVEYTTIGVRPLPASARSEGAVTRRHFMVDHARKHGIEGLWSIVGGKLTTYRSLAEETASAAARHLGRDWSGVPLRMGPSPDELTRRASERLAAIALPQNLAPRLTRLYGPRVVEVLDLAEARKELAVQLPGSAALAAEVVHALQAERARTTEDVLKRRLMLLPSAPETEAAVNKLIAQGRDPAARP